jgi:hypothetical protein
VKPAPSDLAVAFRSFERRRREAMSHPVDDAESARQMAAIDREFRTLLDRIATDLGVNPGRDVGTTAGRIAARIDATRHNDWRDEEFDRLSDDALEAGRLLRDIDRIGRQASGG